MVFAKTALIKEHPMCHCHHLTIIEWEGVCPSCRDSPTSTVLFPSSPSALAEEDADGNLYIH